MRGSLAPLLRCPECRTDGALALESLDVDARETRAGDLVCTGCHARFPVARGVAHLMVGESEHVRREAAGLQRFAEAMRRDGWDRARVLNLPHEQSGYWFVQDWGLALLLGTVGDARDQVVLDVGANTCWASAHLAERGFRVVALDISTTEMQGLHTADWWMDDRGVYFERVLGTMTDPPLADQSVDVAFCCQVLHHNDAKGLQRTMRELHRVLRPGGRLVVANETMRFPLERGRRPGEEVEEFEGYEHAFFFHQYWLAARGAGFRVRVCEPGYMPFFSPTDDFGLIAELRGAGGARDALARLGRSVRPLRRAYLAWRNIVAGGVSLNMLGVKPGP